LPGSSKEYEAELIGTDPGTDIAIIRIDADDLPVITVGSSSNLKVGDVVFAIGNPYGIGQTVTQGIISAQNKTGIGINKYENYIQTDASINPGNSGGALVDSRGVLIGINTAIITRSGGNHGIGFAIEIDMVKDIATKLIENGSIERGYLGVSIDNLNKSMRKMYKNDKGALITDVMPDTAAEKSGLKRGDLIIEVDGDTISDRTSLQNTIGMHAPGTKVTITFERDGKVMSLKITLGSLKEAAQARSSQQLEGIEMTDLTEDVRYRFRVPSNVEGVLITSVQADSEASEQGLKPGDVIIQVEQYVVTDLQEISKALEVYKGDYKRVYVNRGGRVFIAVLK
ncbi:MAG: PDZ domain-containing protein, partial [Sulfurimonadaceae bacterium]|nr:PDZ domain-containing protein [Sulfurimonadaceae bacterium]